MTNQILQVMLLALVLGGLVYNLLVLLAVRRYRRQTTGAAPSLPPVSILKPVSAVDPALRDNLASFFAQDYPCFELVFGIHEHDPHFARLLDQLAAQYPHVHVQLEITGYPPTGNPKVHTLAALQRSARHDLLVVSDSDVSVDPHFLRHLVSELQRPGVQLVSCPYRGVSHSGSLWSRLEAIGMNTEFLSGILVARMLEGMHFATGAAVAVKRSVLESIGGFDALRDFLADDFVLGQRAAEHGEVLLSSYPVAHHLEPQSFASSFSHRLRWSRSTRRSRPAGYIGQVFTYAAPWAILTALIVPKFTLLALATLAVRLLSGFATARVLMPAAQAIAESLQAPLQDMLSFAVWFCGLFGSTVLWRGVAYRVLPDGRVTLDDGPGAYQAGAAKVTLKVAAPTPPHGD